MSNEITTDDIEGLRSDAGAAGDLEMVAICCIALGDNAEDMPEHDHSVTDGMSMDRAWDRCVEVIMDTRGSAN